MSKTKSTDKSAQDLIPMMETCKSILEGFRGEEGTKKKTSSYSISCLYDDKGRLPTNVTIRDGRIDDFEKFFNRAIAMKPDSISVKFFEGEGVTGREIPGSENIIRVTDKRIPEKKQPLSGINPQTVDSHPDFALQLYKLEAKAELDKKEMETKQRDWETAKRIEELEKENDRLKKENEQYDAEIERLEGEKEKAGKLFGANLETGLKAGLAGLASMAQNNPEGKMFGLIPNKALAGFFGGGGGNGQLSEASETNENPRKVPYNQITDFFDSLTDEEFNMVFDVMKSMAEDKGNIVKIHGALPKPTSM